MNDLTWDFLTKETLTGHHDLHGSPKLPKSEWDSTVTRPPVSTGWGSRGVKVRPVALTGHRVEVWRDSLPTSILGSREGCSRSNPPSGFLDDNTKLRGRRPTLVLQTFLAQLSVVCVGPLPDLTIQLTRRIQILLFSWTLTFVISGREGDSDTK